MYLSFPDGACSWAAIPPQNWLAQLRRQCALLVAHPQLNVKEAMYALGTLLSKIQHCIDEGRLNAGLVESMGESLLQLAEAGILQQQAGQLMPIPLFRVEALQQFPTVFSHPQTRECPWDEPFTQLMEPVMKSLLQGLLAENVFADPRCSYGEMFARLSQYLFWVRQAIALEIEAGTRVTPAQLAAWETCFRGYGADSLAQANDDGLSSDFYLLKGLALL
ncbi:MAG: hypothetical protein ACRDD5_15825 [Silvania sp.]|uniref:hypothetical protein n=1 Tax=Silvania sp. TaxID=3016633 RepID=UPI003EE65D7E